MKPAAMAFNYATTNYLAGCMCYIKKPAAMAFNSLTASSSVL